jgi:hypothetical protein
VKDFSDPPQRPDISDEWHKSDDERQSAPHKESFLLLASIVVSRII